MTQPITYALPQTSMTSLYEPVSWSCVLTNQKKPSDSSDASVPPKPMTDGTARFGNMSATTGYMVADQPWCAALASAKSNAASHLSWRYGVETTGNVQMAQRNEAVLRARFTDQPRFKKWALKPPPKMLPKHAPVPTMASGRPNPLRS